MSREVVVLRALGIGDLLTAVPALRGLRRGFPTHRVTLLTPAWLSPLALLTGTIDTISDLPGLDAMPEPAAAPDRRDRPDAAARRGGPDIAVNLHGRGPRSHRLLLRLRPARVMAYAHPEVAEVAGPSWREAEHEVTRWCRLLAAYGVTADPEDLGLAIPAAVTASGAVVVHPGAGSPARRWPADRFARVARRLAALGLPVVVTGSAAETALTARVTADAGLDAGADLGGRLTLLELAGLVSRARLVVCGDTGVGHLATAYRTPVVLLFGPTSPDRWGPPPGRAPHTVLWTGRTGDPHGRRVDPGLAEIGPAKVIDAARDLLTVAARREK
jgi:ADP-heptose:LPS heptosyltransferase